MNDPTPLPPLPAPIAVVPVKPVINTTLGGFIAVGLVWGLHLFGINLPAGFEAGLASVIAALAAYLPKSGRK